LVTNHGNENVRKTLNEKKNITRVGRKQRKIEVLKALRSVKFFNDPSQPKHFTCTNKMQ
jgi:hypothetical protein